MGLFKSSNNTHYIFFLASAQQALLQYLMCINTITPYHSSEVGSIAESEASTVKWCASGHTKQVHTEIWAQNSCLKSWSSPDTLSESGEFKLGQIAPPALVCTAPSMRLPLSTFSIWQMNTFMQDLGARMPFPRISVCPPAYTLTRLSGPLMGYLTWWANQASSVSQDPFGKSSGILQAIIKN